MPQVRFASTAAAFDTAIEFAYQSDVAVLTRTPEGRPAAARIVFGGSVKEFLAAKCTRESTDLFLLVVPWRCPGRLGKTSLEN